MAVALARGPSPSQISHRKADNPEPYSTGVVRLHAATDQSDSVSSRRSHYTCQGAQTPSISGLRVCTRASFELLPPRDPQLTSPAGPTCFTRLRSAPAPAPSNLIQHTSFIAKRHIMSPLANHWPSTRPVPPQKTPRHLRPLHFPACAPRHPYCLPLAQAITL